MNSNVWKLAEELVSAEVLINEYINLQDTLYSEAVILTEGPQEGTPRFLIDKLQSGEEETEDGLSACFKSVNYLKKSLGKAMDLETAIINQYKTFISRFKSKEPAFQLPSKKTAKKSCENCEELENILENLDNELENYKKLNVSLNSQLGKQQKDLQGYKNMYNELKSSHEEVLRELKSRVSLTEDLESSRKTKKQANDSNDYKIVEKSLFEATKRYENELGKNLKLQNSFESLLEENEVKQEKIEKAQIIIKKLNEECEKLAKELGKVEEELDFYKKESKSAEKIVVEARKKFNELDGFKRTEERLREENSNFKVKLMEISENAENEKNHLKKVIEDLLYDKKHLEKDMEDLEEKLTEIDEMNQNRISAFNNACQQIHDLNDALEKKEKELENLSQDFKIQLENKEQEKENIKKHAENLIRSLSAKPHQSITSHSNNPNQASHSVPQILSNKPNHSTRGSHSPPRQAEDPENSNSSPIASTTFTISPALQLKIENLENQLQESRTTEKNLKNLLKTFHEKEKNFQILTENSISGLNSQFLADRERWMMKLEDLEGSLQSLERKNDSLLRALADFSKLLKIKDTQIEDLLILAKDLENNSSLRVKAFQDENNSIFSLINQEILPRSRQILDQHLDLAHKKIKNNSMDSERLRIELEDLKDLHNRTLYRLEIAQNEFCQASRQLSKYEQELKSIKSLLENPGLAITYEPSSNDSQLASEVLQKVRDVFEYNLALISQRTEARSALEKLEVERQMFLTDVKVTKEDFLAKQKMMNEENLRLRDLNEFLKNNGNKEKEEKVLIQEHWEKEVNFFKAQGEYIKGLLTDVEKEKFKVEAELKQVRNEFVELMAGYERVVNEKNILQKCFEELNQKIWSNSERIRNEWKKDSMMSSGSMFK